ncbi:Myb-like protein G [Hordeum vulgare]|nr:Myb-like protein G [Hordeum vulgare]
MAERGGGGEGEGTSSSPGKKARKPYTITRPRERWSPEEHERFLDALLRFGRDWKKIEEHVRTKTAVQIRSHAQKYFLKVQRLGLAAGLPPPQHPSRRHAMSQQQISPADGTAVLHGQPQHCPPGAVQGTIGWSYPGPGALPAPNDMQNLDWAGSSGSSAWVSHGGAGSHTEQAAATHPGGSSFMGPPSFDDTSMDWTGTGSTGEASAIADAEDETIPLPLSPGDMHFAQVYRFIGDIFDPATPCRIEAHLQKLKDMDGITVKTILLVLRNLETNLAAPQFEPIESREGNDNPDLKESIFREVTSPILATAKRHEGYQTLWQICYDISDTVLLRNLMFSTASETLHTRALLSSPGEDVDLTSTRKSMSFVERRRLLYLSKIAATVGKDVDYEVKVAHIDADIRILKLQEEIVQHDPEYAHGKHTSKLLRPSELIEMCMKRGRELSLKAFEVFAWTGSSFRSSNKGLSRCGLRPPSPAIAEGSWRRRGGCVSRGLGAREIRNQVAA